MTPTPRLSPPQGALTLTAEDRGAVVSPCGRYRYLLWRRWAPGTSCLFVMLNPSTADASADDPTIRRCVGFARAWGHGAIEVVNLYAWRATDPADLKAALRRGEDVVGADNDETIAAARSATSRVVVAWGAHARDATRVRRVLEILARHGREVECLGRSREGQPRHPLMLASATPLEPWSAALAAEVPR